MIYFLDIILFKQIKYAKFQIKEHKFYNFIWLIVEHNILNISVSCDYFILLLIIYYLFYLLTEILIK